MALFKCGCMPPSFRCGCAQPSCNLPFRRDSMQSHATSLSEGVTHSSHALSFRGCCAETHVAYLPKGVPATHMQPSYNLPFGVMRNMTFLCKPGDFMQFWQNIILEMNHHPFRPPPYRMESRKDEFSLYIWTFHVIPSKKIIFWKLTPNPP